MIFQLVIALLCLAEGVIEMPNKFGASLRRYIGGIPSRFSSKVVRRVLTGFVATGH
jgi:hypothetical protein